MISILGYCDKMSAAPGEAIRFMVSCEDGAVDYETRIVRLLCTDDHPDGPGRRELEVESPVSGRYPGRRQAIRMGSCVVVPPDAALDSLESFTVQVLVRATTPEHGRQALVARWCNESRRGFALVLEGGGAALMLGGGAGEPALVATGKGLVAHEWYRVTASFDARCGAARVAQAPLSGDPLGVCAAEAVRPLGSAAVALPDAPLLFAAWSESPPGTGLETGGHFNGKLEAPRLAAGVRGEREMAELPAAEALGVWDFARDIDGETVTDLSPKRLHGHVVNLPTRAVTGHNWTGECLSWRGVPRSSMRPSTSTTTTSRMRAGRPISAWWFPRNGRAGCMRPASQRRPASTTCPSWSGRAPARRGPRSPSWCRARPIPPTPIPPSRSPTPWTRSSADPSTSSSRRISISRSTPELGQSLYDTHFDGSPMVYSSRLRPVLNIRPGTRLWNLQRRHDGGRVAGRAGLRP